MRGDLVLHQPHFSRMRMRIRGCGGLNSFGGLNLEDVFGLDAGPS